MREAIELTVKVPMRLIPVILIFLAQSIFAAEVSTEAKNEIERLDRKISEIGGFDDFARSVAEALSGDGCEALLGALSSKSDYRSPQDFLSACERGLAGIEGYSNYELGGRTYHVVTKDGSPPFIATATIEYPGAGWVERLHIKLDLESGTYQIIELSFLGGGAKSYVRH